MSNEIAACGQCGSTALHHQVFGMPTLELLDESRRRPELRLTGCCVTDGDWSAECVTCGQRRIIGRYDDSSWTTAARPEAAGLITAYAELTRQAQSTFETSAISYLGLWLLLARFAPVVAGAHRARLADVLGASCQDAATLASRLLEAPHSTVAAALGAWSNSLETATLPVAIEVLPDQVGLDRWASEHTHGLIPHFPLQLHPLTGLVLATALVLQPRWTERLSTDENGLLVLHGGLQTIVDTDAAGLVAVAKPFSENGVDVVSVIAAQDVSPSDVWRAVDEIIVKLNVGALWHGEPADRTFDDGHAWSVRETTDVFDEWSAPDDGDCLWRSHLPCWTASADSELTHAPGVAELIAALREAAPELDGEAECVQAATVAYDANGFEAAAVTALTVDLTGVPRFVERTVHRVEVTFDRPHAVVAIARGGPWEGVPLLHCWVTP
jgi:hypothetical protein